MYKMVYSYRMKVSRMDFLFSLQRYQFSGIAEPILNYEGDQSRLDRRQTWPDNS